MDLGLRRGRRRTHVASGDRQFRREEEENGGKIDVAHGDLHVKSVFVSFVVQRETYYIGNPANNVGKNEGSFREHVAASHAVYSDGDHVGNVEHDDRGGDDGIECADLVSLTLNKRMRIERHT